MPTQEEPNPTPAESETQSEAANTISLVDLFDQLDRKSFRRALEQRDSVYPFYTNR